MTISRVRFASGVRFATPLALVLASALIVVWGCDSPTEGTPPPNGIVPQVGDLLELNVQTESACEDPVFRGARVAAVGETVIIAADTLNPEPTFTEADYREFARAFDQDVRPLTDDLFGPPVDVDGTRRVLAFFTQEVNRLAASEEDGVVLGFFFARDLFPHEPTNRLQACEASNEANLIYLRVPDPDGQVGTAQTLEQVRRFTVTTMAHEHQHLVNANRRLFVHMAAGAQPFEALWLNEALSHATEEFFFYQESGLSPRSNLEVEDLRQRGQQALDAFNRIQIINMFRIAEYMQGPLESSVYDTEDGTAMRGAAWHFLRYALDREGGSDADRLDRLVNSTQRGFQNLEQVLVVDPREWMRDWSVALYADDRIPDLPLRHVDRSWNHADFYRQLRADDEPVFPEFPIETHDLGEGGRLSLTVRGGGAAYVRFGVGAGERGEVRTNSSTECPANRRFSLAVGESNRLSGEEAGTFCVEATPSGAEFVVVAFYGGNPDEELELAFEGLNVRPVQGPPTPVAVRAPGSGLRLRALAAGDDPLPPRPNHRFHQELMLRAERELTPRVHGAGGGGMDGFARGATSHQDGLPDALTLTVLRTL